MVNDTEEVTGGNTEAHLEAWIDGLADEEPEFDCPHCDETLYLGDLGSDEEGNKLCDYCEEAVDYEVEELSRHLEDYEDLRNLDHESDIDYDAERSRIDTELQGDKQELDLDNHQTMLYFQGRLLRGKELEPEHRKELGEYKQDLLGRTKQAPSFWKAESETIAWHQDEDTDRNDEEYYPNDRLHGEERTE